MKTVDWKNIELGITVNGLRNVLVKRVISPFRRFRRLLEKSQWWSGDQLLAYQTEKITELLWTAYRHVPYYRGMMQVYGVSPKKITSINDIKNLPILEKHVVKQNTFQFLSETMMYPTLYKCRTAGTTGEPLYLFRDLNNIGFEYACLRRQAQWAGLQDGTTYVSLKGEVVAPKKIKSGKYWSFSFAEKKLAVSSIYLTEQNVHKLIEEMKRREVQYVDGYPSPVFKLAKFMQSRDIQFPLKAVLTTAEPLGLYQKKVIEETFLCNVYDYYGMAERVAAIHMCEHSNYHVVPEYSFVELLENSALPENYYELVGTGLSNYAMPLIRYRTGDAVKASDTTCPCKRAYPVVESIGGRISDYIITPGGKYVWMFDHIFQGSKNLIQAQLYQPDLEHVVVRIVPDKYYKQSDGKKIVEQLQQGCDEKISFRIECLNSIPVNDRGKVQSVISDVSKEGFGSDQNKTELLRRKR
ncbi:phenylacetate--CoA ligase family protein [candidate division KSB1 bacterium]|nr:phenylacetate--CoA ligase family protein [candidate division KSB1 bacterium]